MCEVTRRSAERRAVVVQEFRVDESPTSGGRPTTRSGPPRATADVPGAVRTDAAGPPETDRSGGQTRLGTTTTDQSRRPARSVQVSADWTAAHHARWLLTRPTT